jgi:preprotein translocase subunit SecA
MNKNNSNEFFEVDFLKLQFQISYDLKELQLETIEKGLMRELEKSFLLQQIDNAWKENLRRMSFLRDSIRWRAYGQKNPLTDYKQESYNFFIIMLSKIRHRVIYFVLRSKILVDEI